MEKWATRNTADINAVGDNKSQARWGGSQHVCGKFGDSELERKWNGEPCRRRLAIENNPQGSQFGHSVFGR